MTPQEPRRRSRGNAVHECVCPQRPACQPHRAIEWGGGEPDVCAGHVHGVGLHRAASDVLKELDIIREQMDRGVYLFVHKDTHEALRSALEGTPS